MPKSITPNQFDYAGIYVEGERSNFHFKKPVSTTFMSGMLVPCGDPIRVFPGVKLDLKMEATIRGCTMVCPPLDAMYIDIFAIFVPDRIVWTHQPQFLGENDTTAWTQNQEYIYPYITYQSVNTLSSAIFNDNNVLDKGVSLGNISLFEHYGLTNRSVPTALNNLKISMIGPRGYYALWNHFFRDENWQRPVLYSKGDQGSSGELGYLVRHYTLGSNYETSGFALNNSVDMSKVGVLMPVNKFHDAYTSLLPQPQFDDGSGVLLPIGQSAPLAVIGDVYQIKNANPVSVLFSSTKLAGVSGSPTTSIYGGSGTVETSLRVDLSSAVGATINQFRTSVMYQRYLEALARSGRRVPEYYEAIYSVKNTAAAHDYPEMLYRSRYLIGVNQVIATADGEGTDWTSHLGDTGAYSLTNLRGVPLCEKDFSEFGYLHIVFCIRSENRYSQMIPEHFLRSTLLDEYNPYFDHIGDVGVPNYLVNNSVTRISNFGFAEAWWFERTQLASSTGAVNKVYGSLKYWTISEEFNSSLTQCTPEFLTFNPAVLNDIFTAEYHVYPQFVGDFLIHGVKSARMSQHSIPGITGRI